jgi:hypothetical protein
VLAQGIGSQVCRSAELPCAPAVAAPAARRCLSKYIVSDYLEDDGRKGRISCKGGIFKRHLGGRREPQDHSAGAMVDVTLCDGECETSMRKSATAVPPQPRLRTLLLHMLYTGRCSGLLMKQHDDTALFRWLVELNIDGLSCEVSVLTRKR